MSPLMCQICAEQSVTRQKHMLLMSGQLSLLLLAQGHHSCQMIAGCVVKSIFFGVPAAPGQMQHVHSP